MKVMIGTLEEGTKIILTETGIEDAVLIKKVGRYTVGKQAQNKSGRPYVTVLTSDGKRVYREVSPDTEVSIGLRTE